jgi:p-cumate 2,3-dioxygenase ferredoxin subunit
MTVATMDKTCIGKMADYPPGEIRPAALADGTALAVYNVDGRIYATADLCTHGEASLSEEGILTGCTVECPWHFGTFDVTNGRATAMPCTIPLKTYAVEVVDEDVYVQG